MASQYDIPWHMLKGLDPTNSDFCTMKGSVTTGMEPSARDEISVKLRSVAYCARGRVFFDVKIDQVAEALKLRSLDHVHVLIAVEPKFGFVKNKVLCLRRLRLLPRQLDWKKALSVWQRQSGFQGEPHTRRPDAQLEVIELTMPSPAGGDAPTTGDPLRDMLHSLQQPVKGTCPDGTAATDGAQGDGGEGTEPTTGPAGDGQTPPDAAAALTLTTSGAAADATSDVAGSEPQTTAVTEAGGVDTQSTVSTDAPAAAGLVCPATETAQAGETQAGETQAAETQAGETQAGETQTGETPAGEMPAGETPAGETPAGETQAGETQAGETPAQTKVAAPERPEEVPADAGPEKAGDSPADTEPTEGDGAAPCSAQVAPPATDGSGREGVVAFRATCYRAGGGKQGHAFSSNEGAENFGGAVQELFNWKVQMKGYDLEVILDVAFDMVSVGLSLTPRALFYRNLVKMGPTSLRSTLCFNLLMMAKPQPYEVVVDPMCGGGSISLEGAQAFPGTFHLCGDSYPDAAPRVALNREFSSRQVSDTAHLAVDVFTWDCTRLPLRDACADVIVSDLPFGKRMGSKFDNRTLYPACLEEMGRICTPRYGRAVLLTQDKRSMEKTLHSHRVRSLWRCRASPYINIGGLDGCAYFLQRTDFVRRAPRPPPARSAPAAQRGPPRAEGASDAVKPPAACPGLTGAQSPAETAESDVPVAKVEEAPGCPVTGTAPAAAEDAVVAAPATENPAETEQPTSDGQRSEVTQAESSAPAAETTEVSSVVTSALEAAETAEESSSVASALEAAETAEVSSPVASALEAAETAEESSPVASALEAAAPEAAAGGSPASEADTATETTAAEVTPTEATAPNNQISEEASPDAKVPEEVTPDAKVPEEVTPDAKVPEEVSPDAKVPEEVTPDAKVPEEVSPDAKVPEEVTPDAKVPEEASPDTKVPEVVSPDAKVSAAGDASSTFSEASAPDAKSPE